MSASSTYDAIVIGSGFAGAVTACRLAEAGLDVCILERGRRYDPSDLPVLPDSRTDDATQSSDLDLPDFTRAFWGLGQGLWDVRDLGDLVVAQAAGWGGGSLIYASVHLRAPHAVFEAWPTPFREEDVLEPFYDLAAYMLGVEVPSTELAKQTQFRRAAEGLAARKKGRHVFATPLAVNFGPREENVFGVKQGICDLRGECLFGCRRQAKNTLDLNYLKILDGSDNAEVKTMAEVVSIQRIVKEGEGLYTVGFEDHLLGGELQAVSAPNVFLGAGAVNTTELLMRNRSHLTIAGSAALGDRFHPNADDLAVVFDCDELQEPDRGPTITSALLYDDGDDWLLVEDGGIPTHLEPILGVFRSPLWLRRNCFGSGSKATSAAGPQRAAYADLPFGSVLDAIAPLSGPADRTNVIVRNMADFARGRGLHGWAGYETEGEDGDPPLRKWSLYPDALAVAGSAVRDRILDELALASEPVLEDLFKSAALDIVDGIEQMGLEVERHIGLGAISKKDLAEWGLRLGAQLIWGSQAGLLGAIARMLESRVMPGPQELLGRISDALRWALDYRWGDGHSAVLLSMGRDPMPWRLDLARESDQEPAAGRRITGSESGATAILLSSSSRLLVLGDVRGRFEKGERLVADGRAFGICEKDELDELGVQPTAESGPGAARASARATLGALAFSPIPAPSETKGDPRRFRTDLYDGDRLDGKEAAPGARGPKPVLHARRPISRTSDRTKQELLLRDLAEELGGELRTNPIGCFLDRRVTVHPQGGCPMANGPDEGVTDANGEVFGSPGLYVMDAAAFPTPVGVNPSATIAAIAEHKVARFLSRWRAGGDAPGEDGFRARQLDAAIDWASSRRPQLDPIRHIRDQEKSEPPQHEPIGIEFTEVMQGTHRPIPRGEASPITTKLKVEVPDLSHLLDENRRGSPVHLQVSGKIQIEGTQSDSIDDAEIDVKPGSSYLQLDSGREKSGKEWRTLEYWLEFEAGGHQFVLDGVKDIRDDARIDVWEDTTTLKFTLSRDGSLFRRGILRLPASEFFGGQMRSFEVTNAGDDPARVLWALTSFAHFFFGHLVDVYLPALGRTLEAAKGLADRGHV